MTTFETSRHIPAATARVFAAISNPKRLALWWGPAGFTNTFHHFEFKPGGRWSFVMHGPDGANYPNESVFDEIKENEKIVIRHVVEPVFALTITLKPDGGGTVVTWSQVFDSAQVAAQIKHIVVPSNEQNLDRWAAEVLKDEVPK